jgi:hypothetical protein
MKNVLDVLLPRILPENVSFLVHPHQGKGDLEKALQDTVPSISKKPGAKILIICDQDKEDCKSLKNKLLEKIFNRCKCDYFVRIVCRELESWFLGDLEAVEKAYPRSKAQQYANKKELREVDSVQKPSQSLLKKIPELSGKETLPKLEVSKKVAKHMNIDSNKSSSFGHTMEAVRKLTATP